LTLKRWNPIRVVQGNDMNALEGLIVLTAFIEFTDR
jgi:hypothetical protein